MSPSPVPFTARVASRPSPAPRVVADRRPTPGVTVAVRPSPAGRHRA